MKLTTAKRRVYWCYEQSQDCIESDEVLLAFYENYFGKLNHQEVSTVKRSGRHWRAKA